MQEPASERSSRRNHRLKPDGYRGGLHCVPGRGSVGLGWGTPRLKNVGGQEAMVKAHGVAMAMVQGHSWVPIRSIGDK